MSEKKERHTFELVRIGIVVIAAVVFTQTGFGQADRSSSTNAAAVFNTNCAMCHGANGAGSPLGKSLQVPDLRSAAIQRHSNTEMARFISEGKGPMPPFKAQMTHQQIMTMVHYIRAFSAHKIHH